MKPSSKKERKERWSMLLTHLPIEASELEAAFDYESAAKVWEAFSVIASKQQASERVDKESKP